MSCTSLLHALGHPGADLAMCLSLTQRQPLYNLLSMSRLKTKQPADCPSSATRHPAYLLTSSFSTLPLSRASLRLRSCLRRGSAGFNKKRVVFADAMGLALTNVCRFTPELSSPSPVQLEGQPAASQKLLCHKLQLGFPQPIQDFKAFLAKLQEQSIQLETCSISENTLSGKVCVIHTRVKKPVYLRVTFDSWRSHQDIPCTFVQHKRCNGLDVGIYSFDLNIPENLDPNQFGFSLRAGLASLLQWDDNRGQNYRICMKTDKSSVGQGMINRLCPTFSNSRPPARLQAPPSCSSKSADLQHFQRCFPSRSGAEWADVCS